MIASLRLVSLLLALAASFFDPALAAAQGQPPVATAQPPAFEAVRLSDAGIEGRWFDAPGSRGAVVLMMAGSTGGFPPGAVARDLAAAGYPALGIAYFSGFGPPIEGLPASLREIDIAYVFRAIDWLRRRVGPARPIVLMGESRGAELALLVASHRRDVAAVLAFAPTSVAWPAVDDPTMSRPAWVLGGRPIPFLSHPVEDRTRQFAEGLAQADKVRRAAIPVERINGPVMLVSSRADALWPSAWMADRIEERLRRARFRHSIVNRQADDASHFLMGPGPGLVTFVQGDFRMYFGGTEQGTRAARDAIWPEVKAFLAGIGDPQQARP